jgi:hypothetical protein
MIVTLTCLAVTAMAGDRWLHVSVDEGGRHGEYVRVQVPLKMIRAFVPLIESHAFEHGHVDLDDCDISPADMRAILEAVHEADDGDYVRVEGQDELVRVAKRGEFLHIRVDERDSWGDADEVVRVKVPMAVVEAMVANDDTELDLIAAIEVLDDMGATELVTVDDGDALVRIWIDDQVEDLDDDDDRYDRERDRRRDDRYERDRDDRDRYERDRDDRDRYDRDRDERDRRDQDDEDF